MTTLNQKAIARTSLSVDWAQVVMFAVTVAQRGGPSPGPSGTPGGWLVLRRAFGDRRPAISIHAGVTDFAGPSRGTMGKQADWGRASEGDGALRSSVINPNQEQENEP